ncbi:MAG: adenylate/guanylate cyclase domain-containing protein [Alphaproteobacteria bacterium]
MAATVGTRRLAAILAADAEGFSRLMGIDEAATLTTLAAHRDIIDGKVVEHGGTVVGSAGDSVLAEFTSVIQAVACAVAIQDELGDRNARMPDDRRMMFRVGVNLGDVIVEGGTIYGEGVNVAARLERLADPGGICVARGVHDQVKGKLSLAFTDMGEQRFKNIAEPVRAYRIERSRPPAVTRQALPAEALLRPGRPSIAVLPFDNMSGERDQEYFSDGITEDITTELSQFHELFVIARNSSFTFKGKAVDVKEVAGKLGVQYVVEGSVRRAGDRVRITAQLIDADSGRHLWAQRFDRVLDDVFAIQDDVTQAIVGAIAPEVGAAERELARRARPDSMRAWEAYQLGMWHFYHLNAEHSAQAKHWFRQAIERDADFAAAHAALAFAIYADAIHSLAEAGAEAPRRRSPRRRRRWPSTTRTRSSVRSSAACVSCRATSRRPWPSIRRRSRSTATWSCPGWGCPLLSSSPGASTRASRMCARHFASAPATRSAAS